MNTHHEHENTTYEHDHTPRAARHGSKRQGTTQHGTTTNGIVSQQMTWYGRAERHDCKYQGNGKGRATRQNTTNGTAREATKRNCTARHDKTNGTTRQEPAQHVVTV